MEETSKTDETFLQRWEERRKKKWLYIFLHVSVYRGLPLAVILFLMISEFRIENMQLSTFLLCIFVFVIGGLWTGLRHFDQVDSMYLRLINNDDIVKGLETLKTGETWNYENLVIQNEDGDNLVVRNELFWFEGDEISAAKLNECFNIVLGDFQRLQKDKDFKNYTAGKKVTIRVFDNSGNDVPLVERTL